MLRDATTASALGVITMTYISIAMIPPIIFLDEEVLGPKCVFEMLYGTLYRGSTRISEHGTVIIIIATSSPSIEQALCSDVLNAHGHSWNRTPAGRASLPNFGVAAWCKRIKHPLIQSFGMPSREDGNVTFAWIFIALVKIIQVHSQGKQFNDAKTSLLYSRRDCVSPA